MPQPTKPEYGDLKIENIKGGLYYDAAVEFAEKTPQLIRELRKLSVEWREDVDWAGRLSVECESPLDPQKYKDLANQGPEAANVLAAILAASGKPEKEPPPVVLRCDDPNILVQTKPDAVLYEFDAVQDPKVTKQFLERCLKIAANNLELPDLKKFGIQFSTVFRLKRSEKNFLQAGKTLLPGLSDQTGLYKSFGGDNDYRRVDLSWVFYRRNSELITHIKFECPGNDRNTTLWLSVDTQTTGQILDKKNIQDLTEYFVYYEEVVKGFLEHVLQDDVLDTHHGKMMTDRWFQKEV